MTASEESSNRMGEHEVLDDATVEDLLAGRYHGDAPDLVAVSRFVRRMRAFADRPLPPPSAALSQLLGDAVPALDRQVPTAPPRRHPDPLIGSGSPLRASAAWRAARRFPVPATVAAVCVVFMALVLGAGSARLLPGPTQNLVAQAVRTATPFDFPEQKKAPAWSSKAPAHQPAKPERAVPGESSAPRAGELPRDGAAPIGPGGTDSPTGSGGATPPPRPTTTVTAPATTVPTRTPGAVSTVPGSSGPGPGVTTTTAELRPPSKPRWVADLSGVTGAQKTGDPDGQGKAVLDANPGRDELCLTLVTSGLDPVTAVHLHAGSVDAGGPIVATFKPNAEMSAGCASVADDLIRKIRKDPGAYYVDVHTSQFPEGALRGQLTEYAR